MKRIAISGMDNTLYQSLNYNCASFCNVRDVNVCIQWCFGCATLILLIITIILSVMLSTREEMVSTSSAVAILDSTVGAVSTSLALNQTPSWFQTERGRCSIRQYRNDSLTLSYTSHDAILFTEPPHNYVVNMGATNSAEWTSVLQTARASNRTMVVQSNFVFTGRVQQIDPTDGTFVLQGEFTIPYTNPQNLDERCKCLPIFESYDPQHVSDSDTSAPLYTPEVPASNFEEYVRAYNANLTCGIWDIDLATRCMSGEGNTASLPENAWCYDPFCYVDKACPGSSKGGFFPNQDMYYIFCGDALVINNWTINNMRQCSVFETPMYGKNAVARGTCDFQDGELHVDFTKRDESRRNFAEAPRIFFDASYALPEEDVFRNTPIRTVVGNASELASFHHKYAALLNSDGHETIVSIDELSPTAMTASVIYADRNGIFTTPRGSFSRVEEPCTVMIDSQPCATQRGSKVYVGEKLGVWRWSLRARDADGLDESLYESRTTSCVKHPVDAALDGSYPDWWQLEADDACPQLLGPEWKGHRHSNRRDCGSFWSASSWWSVQLTCVRAKDVIVDCQNVYTMSNGLYCSNDGAAVFRGVSYTSSFPILVGTVLEGERNSIVQHTFLGVRVDETTHEPCSAFTL